MPTKLIDHIPEDMEFHIPAPDSIISKLLD